MSSRVCHTDRSAALSPRSTQHREWEAVSLKKIAGAHRAAHGVLVERSLVVNESREHVV